ncbi:MAG: uncharacterized protein SRB2_03624 [Desulfobacteraceae bacterium Eth-SRB2]|nr:MAG: uncharacterized protein SRB2_03624 [Desulfobacteraceae bacterium Eth-SRB2]
MNRRNFLLKSTGWLIGSFFGLNSFSKAFAIEKHRNQTVDQPRIALIIDDIGFSRSHARQFLNLGVPITFAILPRLAYSYDLALEIHDNGHEILLHQPMEPYNIDSFDPGPGALYVGDGADKIERIIEENIAGVPYAVGVNNHMGSRFTEAYKETREVLENVKKRDLFFVDSFTSSHSMGYRTARKLHMAATGRNIFLDNVHNDSAIYNQLNKLKRHSKKYGHAVGIGHPFPETVHTIGRFVKNIKDSDISLVHVSDVL